MRYVKIVLLAIIGMLQFYCGLAADGDTSTKRTIHVATAGTLLNYISDSEKYTIEELTLTGELNGTDFRLLRDMAGCNYLGKRTSGKLVTLDLTDVKFVVSDEKYLDTKEIVGVEGNVFFNGSYHYSITDSNIIPTGIFLCCNLKEVYVPNYVTKIGNSAFEGCSYITSFTIPNSVMSIGNSAFGSCFSLTSITIPNSVTSIGNSAFYSCLSLTSVTIPNSVTSIGNSVFWNCRSLTSIIIPNSVTSIGDGFLGGCSALTSYNIPDYVTSIGKSAFENCTGLTSITIPNSVKSVGDYAFQGCTGLKDVVSKIETPFEISEYTFSVYSSATLFVPTGTKSLYRSKKYWNKFNNIAEELTLSIKTTGNGTVIFDGVSVRDNISTFYVIEGTSATVTFTPDAGYRIASVKVNGTDVTSNVVSNQYTISNITANTTLAVTFEAIPPTTYAFTISAVGNGTVTYDGNTVRGKTSSFIVVEGTNAVVTFSVDEGYRLKSVKLDNADATSAVVNSQYTISNIKTNISLEVTFEAIPIYSLNITATGNGSVMYEGNTIKGKTSSFTIIEGSYVTVQLSADDGYRLKSISLNGQDVTADVVNNQYTTDKIIADVTLIVEFEIIPNITDAGIAYTVTSYDEQTVIVAAGNYGNVLTVPASFTAKEKTWTVVGIDEDALKDNTALAAIIWNPEVAFTAKVSNPNLLLYVKDAQYAPTTIQNVVVNNQAENIVLVEAASGNDFYCISYEHNYSMISGYKTCQGWETLVLPFDVTMMINAKGQELTPYINWQYGNSLRPFWLYEMTTQGWKAGSAIKANTPYIISMPNNEMYDVSFNQTGNIQFIGTNVEVKASTEMKTGQHGNKRLVANYQTQEPNADIYALNVSNEWSQNTAMEVEGSTFIRSLRSVHPFEAYLTVEGSNAPWAIPIFENLPTGINEKLIVNSEKFATATDWYTIDGRKLQGEPKQNGIYIFKGKKVRK